jgi:hypothetical protein
MDERCDDLVLLYVKHLVAEGLVPLVALYCKHVRSKARRVAAYVSFMVGVRARDDRELCLALARRHFPSDLPVVARRTVEAIRGAGGGDDEVDRVQAGVAGLLTDGGSGVSGGAAETAFAASRGLAFLGSAADSSSSSSSSLTVSTGDSAKIAAVEWLCIADEHRAEAVAQANALLRDFFLPRTTGEAGSGGLMGQGLAKGAHWRFDAAELLVLSHKGLGAPSSEGSPSSSSRAFPGSVLAAIHHALGQAEAGADRADREGEADADDSMGGGGGGSSGNGAAAAAAGSAALRPAAEWASVLKEHQCWRVLLRALGSFGAWRRHAASSAACDPPPPFAPEPSPAARAGPDALEEHAYRVKRDAVKHAQLTEAWLRSAADALVGQSLEAAAEALMRVLDFTPADDLCFAPDAAADGGDDGEAAGGVVADDMVAALRACDVDPTGFMIFGADAMAGDEEEGSNGDGDDNGDGDGDGGVARGGLSGERAARAREAGARRRAKEAGRALRREVVPVACLLLHEAHHETAKWLLQARRVALAVPALATSHGPAFAGLAAAQLRRAVQVADVVASRRLGLFACHTGPELRRLLAAVHASADLLLDITGALDLDA